MYYKGGNMLHTIRQVINNDSTWRTVLRGLNTEFRHRVVTGDQVRSYMSAHAGIDLRKIFEQYLTTTKIPVFEYRLDGPTLSYRWANVVPGFAMPIRVATASDSTIRLKPTEAWQTTTLPIVHPDEFRVDENFFVDTHWVDRRDAATRASDGATTR